MENEESNPIAIACLYAMLILTEGVKGAVVQKQDVFDLIQSVSEKHDFDFIRTLDDLKQQASQFKHQ